MVSFINDILPYIMGGITGYFYPAENIIKDKWMIYSY